jgi:hypothetical protein
MAAFDAAERKRLAAKGVAMSDGSYPIRNTTDLANAYKDYIRTGRSKAVAAHINGRAKALGVKSPIERELPAEDKGENEKRETYDSIIQRHTARLP